MVVTPNREAARSLDVPSRTLTDLAKRTLGRNGRHLVPALIARRVLARVVARSAEVSDVPGFAASGEATIRELLRAGVDLEVLQEDASGRVRRLARIASAYRRELEAEGWIDDADALWRAADLCRSNTIQKETIVVVGYPRLPVAERRFIDAFAAPGSVVWLPMADTALFTENQAAGRDFESMGWSVRRIDMEPVRVGARLALAWVGSGSSGVAGAGDVPASTDATDVAEPPAHEAVHARSYPDLDAEVRGVLADVKRLLANGTPADRIAVVARHERSYGPHLLAVAAEYGVPFRVLYSTPLSETRFGSWLAHAVDVRAEGFPFEQTARWLADPVSGALDANTWPKARRTHPPDAEAWRDLGVRIPKQTWPERASRNEFIELLEELMLAFDVAGNCARWPREAVALARFLDGLATLPDLDRAVSFESFRAELTELAAVLSVPASPGNGGVELHTPLSLFGARVEHVFVVGAAEGQLPAPVRSDPLLDPFERARLHQSHPAIEDVRAAARREEISFWALLQCATAQITLTYPKLLGRSETLPSPYLERLGVNPESAGPSAIGSRRELRRVRLAGEPATSDDPLLPHARHAHRVELGRESETPHGPYDGVTGIAYDVHERGVGVSRLIDMASCPFRFWGRSVLGLQEPEEAPVEFDYALRGILYHDVLHRAVDKARQTGEAQQTGGQRNDLRGDVQGDFRSRVLEQIEAAFAAAEEALEAERGVRLAALPNWDRDRNEHMTVLRRTVQGEDFATPETEVVALEAWFRGTWREIPVRGRIDRVDRRATGVVLVDYKSGSSVTGKAKDADGKATVDLQLPVYSAGAEDLLRGLMRQAEHGAEERADPSEPPVQEAYYYSVTKARKISTPDASADELERIACEVTAGWERGAFPVDPDVREDTCRYCDLDAVCRKGPRLERKRRRE